jgi:anti-sigma factor RsiW
MSTCDQQLLSAYVDDELTMPDRARVDEHLRHCAECARELDSLRHSVNLLRRHHFERLSDDEMARLHVAIDEEASDRPVLRLGMLLGGLAASILVVSCAWLMEMPGGIRNAGTMPRPGSAVMFTPTPRWERVAMTLRADLPAPVEYTPAQFADAGFADWMLDGLSPRIGP